jgi:hypothetical protein
MVLILRARYVCFNDVNIVSNKFAASIPQKSMLGGFMVQGATNEAAEWSKKGKLQDFLT